ncbi:PAS domain-containing protein [Pseudomonas sp. NPDC087690]|jgi:PAS domain S-box-containing protein|uniref:PAS domain-containing protein n=1 Tax=Pseudomonas sp. NPDC087690 TaxID=3364446 RepID=UPI00381FC4F9
MAHELERVIDALPSVVFTALADGAVDYVNQQWHTYTGRNAEDAMGMNWQMLIHPADRQALIERWQRIVSSGVPEDIEARLRRFDGTYRWFLWRVTALDDRHDQPRKWCAIGTDIENSRAKVNGEMSNPFDVHSIIDSIPAMVAFMNPAGELEQVNRQIVDYIGGSFEEMKNWDAGETVHPEDLPAVIVAWTHSVTTGEPYDVEIRIRRVDGVYHWFHVRGLPIRDSEGNIRHWCVLQIDIDERRRDKALIAKVLAEVSASEDRLRNIIDAVPGFVWSAAADGNVGFVNQRWCDYTGMTLDEACGSGWTTSVHPDDAGSLASYWFGLLQSGTAGEHEARLRRFDGTYRWFLIRAVPQRDDAGQVLRWYGENTDIEDRKRAELLLDGEKRLLGLMAGGSSLTAILQTLCQLVEVFLDRCVSNVVLVDLKRAEGSQEMSLRMQQGAGANMPAGLIPGAGDTPLCAERCPIVMAATFNTPIICQDLSAQPRWQDWCKAALSHGFRGARSMPITSNSGHITGVLTVLHRETTPLSADQENLIAQFTHLASIAIDRVRAEAALKQSEAFLAKAQRLSATGTFSWRVSSDEITWSDEICRILELAPDTTPGFDAIYTRIHPDDVSSHREMIRRQRRKGRDFEHEHRLLMPDASVKYVRLVAHSIKDAEDGIEYIAALQDITQSRLAEEVLNKARSELTHLARVASLGAVTASIAHEVNQPLAGIITNASTCLRMLGADPPNVDGARETARRTIRDGNRAADVINRLRALFSKKDITLEDVDLNDAAREVIALLLGELQRNGVVLHPQFADALPMVRGDRVQLQQVILNLIMNAVEAMNTITCRSRQMRVSTRLDENQRVCLEVSDSGNGVDPQDMERIFNAFYTTKSAGMGVGLSISRSIIERHDGALWATANEGPGTTFQFSIPALAERCATERDAHDISSHAREEH